MANLTKPFTVRVTGFDTNDREQAKRILQSAINNQLTNNERETLSDSFSILVVPSCNNAESCDAIVDFKAGLPLPLFLSGLKRRPLESISVQVDDGSYNYLDFDCHFHGFTQLYPTLDRRPINADIIAITGLDGHAYGSWAAKSSPWPMWLRHFLAQDRPQCRTMIYGYNSKLSEYGFANIKQYCQEFLQLVKLVRMKEAQKRPIFFIAYSFGGILLARSLVKAQQTTQETDATIAALFPATYAVMFFAVPHYGMVVDDMIKILGPDHPREQLLKELSSGQNSLGEQLEHFINIIQDRKIVSFVEAQQTKRPLQNPETGKWARSGEPSTVLPYDGAILKLPEWIERKFTIHENHSMLVKFSRKTVTPYKVALQFLKEFEESAPAIVQKRFSPNTCSAVSTIPFGRDSNFVGRGDILNKINSLFKEHNRAGIYGLGGIGKSQIAIEYAYRLRDSDSNTHIFWVHASNPERYLQSFKAIANDLAIAGHDAEKDILGLAAQWLKNKHNGPWLLILDNADDLKILFKEHGSPSPTARLIDFIPDVNHGKVLVTSRDKSTAGSIAGYQNLQQIREMDNVESLQLVKRYLEASNQVTDEEAKQLVESLDRIPLAIAQACAYLNQNSLVTIPRYIELKSQDGNKLLRCSWPDLRRDKDVPNAVTDSFGLSLRHISEHFPKAAELLSVMSMFDRQKIPGFLIQSYWRRSLALEDNGTTHANAAPSSFTHVDEVPTDEALSHLLNFSLIKIESNNMFDMHSIVQMAVKAWCQAEDKSHLWQNAALNAIADISPDGNYENWTTWSILLPHVEAVLADQQNETSDNLDLLLYHSAWYLRETGNYELSEKRAAWSLKIRHERFGESHPSTLTSMDNLASTLWNQGRWNEAEKLFVKVMEMRKRVLGEEHPDTLTSMANLTSTYQNQGRWNEAEKLFVQVIETSSRVLGKEHPDTLTSMDNLASTYRNQGRWNEAEKLFVQVMETRKRVQGEEHPSTLTSMANLASTYRNQGRCDEAEKLDAQVMETRKRVLDEKATSESHLDKHDKQIPTDFSYASITQSRTDVMSGQTYSSSGKDLEVRTEDTEYAYGDPAFAGSQGRADKQDAQNLGLHTAKTEYPSSTTSNPRNEGYIDKLAEELFARVESYQSDRESLEHIFEILPDLLRAFALKLGQNSQTQMHRDLSHFVHKHRGRIRGSFKNMFLLHVDPVEPGEYQQMKLPDQHNEYHRDEAGLDEDDEETISNTSPYHEFIIGTPAYKWFVASLQREATSTRATPDLMEDIRGNIMRALPSSYKVSRKAPSPQYKATFKIPWNPLSFVKEQQYSESPDKALERAITLTGSANDAQALTTKEYLSQTWPATGEYIMRLVTDVVCPTIHNPVESNLPDGTELHAQIEGSKFTVTTVGTSESIAEIGQQFAWLCAALRSSRSAAGVATCSPFIRCTPLEKTHFSPQASDPALLAEISCVIEFKMSEPTTSREIPPGQCWHNMFRNPVIVSGYPILTKHKHGIGLEMPLNMISHFAGSKRASMFDRKVFIKGFSTMLIATKKEKDLIIWHYFYNSEGEKLSYNDHQLKEFDAISLLQLDTARHVVGWCSDCMYNAGAADAQYDIGRTGLPGPHAGCILENVSISAGKLITGGVNFVVGMKDIPIHLTCDGYIPQLESIARKYVVLWDEADKRGWLVNGTSALLHLVRASLKYKSEDRFSSNLLFEPDKMNNVADHKPISADKVLVDRHNMELKIYPDKIEIFEEEEEEVNQKKTDSQVTKTRKKTSFYLFQHHVEHYCHILDQIMDHQILKAGKNGINLKVRVRQHLEGWDFTDLATNRDLKPRVATLAALGYNWVNFIRSIDAVTLFGHGFGDIIRPVEFHGMCPLWKSLPTQKYYLATSVFDLNDIMKTFGNKQANPLVPADGLLWHCPGDLIAPCQCQRRPDRAAGSHNHDPVQVFYPQSWQLLLHKIRSPKNLKDSGAVVFGHSVSWGYCWKKEGEELKEGKESKSNSS